VLILSLTLLGSLLFLALYEYWGHRVFLHHPWFVRQLSLSQDHIEHHKRFTIMFLGEEPWAWYDAVWIRGLFGLVWSSILMVPVAIWLYWPSALMFVVLATSHGAFWQLIHNRMHDPKREWWRDRRWFMTLCKFHSIHHRKLWFNYGFVFAPWMDKLFGTYRRT